jgi:hypothetical protein
MADDNDPDEPLNDDPNDDPVPVAFANFPTQLESMFRFHRYWERVMLDTMGVNADWLDSITTVEQLTQEQIRARYGAEVALRVSRLGPAPTEPTVPPANDTP